MVEHQLERRRERCLEVGGVGQPVLQGLASRQIIEGGDHFVEGLLEGWITLDKSAGVLAMGHRMLAFLAHKRVSFLSDRGVGDHRLGLRDHAHDHLLERDR